MAEFVYNLKITDRRHMMIKAIMSAAILLLFSTSNMNAESIRVTILGSGGPEPSPDRFGPSTLVEAGDETLIFDAGRGANIRLAQAKVSLSTITMFLTHLHSDHLNGLSDIWMSGYIAPTFRKTPLEIYGPPGIVELADGMQVAYRVDVDIRSTEYAERGIDFDMDAASFTATAIVEEGVFFNRGGVQVSAITVDHAASEAFAYRVDYAGRSVVISGDTRLTQNLIDKAKGADLVIHEVMAVNEELLKSSPLMQKILEGHTPPSDAGRLFSEVEPKMAAFNHIILAEASDDDLVMMTRETYDGPLTVGQDLLTFLVDDKVSVQKR
jgi:ribonuclease Z